MTKLEELAEYVAKQRAGLVPRKVRVKREGKTFQRTQWVRPEEVSTSDVINKKAKGILEAIKFYSSKEYGEKDWDSPAYKLLEDYATIAFGGKVPEERLDDHIKRARKTLEMGTGTGERLKTEEEWRKWFKENDLDINEFKEFKAWKLMRDAESYSDKVIALDSWINLEHQKGLYLTHIEGTPVEEGYEYIKQLLDYLSTNVKKSLIKQQDKNLKAVFLGTGPSGGTKGEGKNSRTMSSLLLEYVGYNILIDCTPDFDKQAKDLESIDVMLLSHGHNDACGGIADLKRWLKDKKQDKVTCWMMKETEDRLKEDFEDLSHLDIKHFESEQHLDIFGVEVIPFQLGHYEPFGDKYPYCAFRVGNALVYAEDVDYPVKDEKLRWFNGVDTVIFDAAIYDIDEDRQIQGHHTVKQALEFSDKLRNVDNFILTQCGNTYPDHEEAESEIEQFAKNKGIKVPEIAYDGMSFIVDWSDVSKTVEMKSLDMEKANEFKQYDEFVAKHGDEIKKASVEPSSHFDPPKPRMAFYTENFSAQELYDRWAKERLDNGKKLSVEKKHNGFRTIMSKEGDDVEIWFEDAKEDKSSIMPGIVSALKKIPDDFVLDGECMIYIGNSPVPRIHMMKLLGSNPKFEDNEKIIMDVFDLPWHKEDLTDKTYKSRRKKLETFAESLGSNFKMTEADVVDGKDALFKAVKEASNMPESEGAMVKDWESKYEQGGTDDWSKVKTVLELKVEILEKHTTEGGNYNYTCGVLQ